MTNKLPKSRAEIRQRAYRNTQQCNLQPQTCTLPTQTCTTQCNLQPQTCTTTQCNLQSQTCNPRIYHNGIYVSQCQHAPYNCTSHRQRPYWCSYCLSTYLFPEYHSNHPLYVSTIQQTIPCNVINTTPTMIGSIPSCVPPTYSPQVCSLPPVCNLPPHCDS